jgi:hypothetical protein
MDLEETEATRTVLAKASSNITDRPTEHIPKDLFSAENLTF